MPHARGDRDGDVTTVLPILVARDCEFRTICSFLALNTGSGDHFSVE